MAPFFTRGRRAGHPAAGTWPCQLAARGQRWRAVDGVGASQQLLQRDAASTQSVVVPAGRARPLGCPLRRGRPVRPAARCPGPSGGERTDPARRVIAPDRAIHTHHAHLRTATLIKLAKLVYSRAQTAIPRPIPLRAARVAWRTLP